MPNKAATASSSEGQSRRKQTFEEMYQAYSGRILNLAYRMVGQEDTARDMTQEVFIKVYENMDSFRGDSQVYTWIYRMATNHILNYLKKTRRQRWLNLMDKPIGEVIHEEDIDPTFWGGSAPRPDRQLEKSQREQLVWSVIRQLAPKYRMPLVLNRYEEMSYQEIADTLQLSLSAVETRIHRAKKELIKRLEPYLNDL
jgi:RNA polymerase sigma-70 factor (ECF subfamily)